MFHLVGSWNIKRIAFDVSVDKKDACITAMEAGITKAITATYPMMKIRIFHFNGSWNNYKYSVMKMTRVSLQWKRE